MRWAALTVGSSAWSCDLGTDASCGSCAVTASKNGGSGSMRSRYVVVAVVVVVVGVRSSPNHERPVWRHLLQRCAMEAHAPSSCERLLRVAFTAAYNRTRWRFGQTGHFK